MLNITESLAEIKVLAKACGFTPDEVIGILDKFDKYPRVYHSSDHIIDLTQKILKSNHTESNERDLLILALFHDYIYDPKSKTNELDSAMVFENQYVPRMDLERRQVDRIFDAIIDTKGHVPRSVLSEQFCYYDLSGFDEDPSIILENEYKIRKEYAWVDWTDYVAGKLEFLTTYRETPIPKKSRRIYDGMGWLAKHVKNESAPNIGIYAGSFNPFHIGHRNILQKAEKIFDKVVIAYGENPYKVDGAGNPLGVGEGTRVPDALKYHQVDFYDTSIVKYFHTKKYEPTLIRGIRNTTDLQAELTQLRWLQELKPDITVVNIVCDLQFEHVSSSGIRAVRNAGFDDLTELARQFTVK